MPVDRVAALYDIHGNLPALEAALTAVSAKQPDLIVIGGDALSGPFPKETLTRLAQLDAEVRFVRGNCERAIVEAFDGGVDPSREPVDLWAAQQLDHPDRDCIAAWAEDAVVEIAGLGAVRFCHASPRSDTECLTIRTPEQRLLDALSGVPETVVVCGHTHMPFDRAVGRWRVVNAGSVGMPYGSPGAHWLLLGPELRPMVTPYDVPAAVETIRRSSWPEAAAFAADYVLNTPSTEEALDAFEPHRLE